MADNNKPLLNGSSLSHLTGASVAAKVVTEVRLPASSMSDVLATINRLSYTGKLEVNFHKGRAMDVNWVDKRETKPHDV
jgi:hypothetical protein